MIDSDHLQQAANVLMVLPYVIGVASFIAALTPTPKDDGLLRKLRRALDIAALNVRHAKNAAPKIRDE